MQRRSLLALAFVVALAVPVVAAAETWRNVPLVDHECLNKVKANPDKHTMSCLLMCSDEGYGIITSDGTWLRFDAKGNEETLKALKASTKKSAIRATVTGERRGDEIKVTAVTID